MSLALDATHPGIFDRPLAYAQASANIGALLRRVHVRAPGEDDGFWKAFDEAAVESSARGNLVPDAHLVALMRQYGVATSVTRDRDFRRFDGIRVRDPFA